MKWKETVKRNLSWFRNSGVLVDEGRMGVHERVWLLSKEHPLVNGNRLLEDGIFKYRRVDCALETAVMFALADEWFQGNGYKEIAANLLRFTQEHPFQEAREEHPEFGLYAHGLTFEHALPLKFFLDRDPVVKFYRDGLCFWNKKWVDDNSWAVILPLYLRAKTDLVDNATLKNAFITAEALLDKEEILKKYSKGQLDGVPHWGGMRSMALAYVYFYTKDQRFRDGAIKSLQKDFEIIENFRNGKTKQPYDLSNCGYFVMQASAVLKSTQDKDVERALETVVNYLISRQSEVGHWPGEWWEGSSGDDIADLVYGQNWATLGLQAYAYVVGHSRAQLSYEKSLKFLAGIQNSSDFPRTNGVWLGSYDVKRKIFGGEDRKEGGPSCGYTGWTNAPINIAFIVDSLSLVSPLFPRTYSVDDISMVHKSAREKYEVHKLRLAGTV